ncbi:transcriptional regulator [Amycolatopsis australiensis]|uniref:DNA-binding transcriptional regulator, MarR family n=1 Tax=Amycolatopsis australiensis TaxID=546364 RepID=A0A1K1SGR2_9PSEU|nr:transcriptional regulator [Amycolatopsis australiensis]SFW83576.1 DNA-binding transcriptional regulator, MarR family [Amycolatopsis australiensis]
MSEHPAAALDETVHQRHRLGILTIAAEAGKVDFGYLRRTLDMTAGNLSRHVTILQEAGLIDVEKGYEGKRPRTWITISAAGRRALAAEMAALRALLSAVERSAQESSVRSSTVPATSTPAAIVVRR